MQSSFDSANPRESGRLSLGVDDSLIRSQVQIPDFDYSTNGVFLYPAESERIYQLNIVEKALVRNTMVVLPTGLGKTFIAAVLMYNFHRFYPNGKIIFLAPTKPLVQQQANAFKELTGIRASLITTLTGSMDQNRRMSGYLPESNHRIFFMTPQILANDLELMGETIAGTVKCIVFDEAHRATGNYAYVQVVQLLNKFAPQNDFRVVALTATPGSDVQSIQNVITNLQIAHIELRTEQSLDVAPYRQAKFVESVVVKLSPEIKAVEDELCKILNRPLSRLQNLQCMYAREPKSLSKYMILMCRDKFRTELASKTNDRQLVSRIEADFALAMSIFHGYELLKQHGPQSLYLHLRDSMGDEAQGWTKSKMRADLELVALFERLKTEFGDSGNAAGTSDFVHPKLVKCEQVVLEHFRRTADPSQTRIIVFSVYRDSVREIVDRLNRNRPVVRAVCFVGHGSAGNSRRKGISIKEQHDVLRLFTSGCYNVLVATCVAEEGLDIGDVDLIVCFDANRSPVRLVQRMGRTGRKRCGKVVMLLTEGKEASAYSACQANQKRLCGIMGMDNIRGKLKFHHNSPRMLPVGIVPKCEKVQFLSLKVNEESDEKNFERRKSAKKENSMQISGQEFEYWKECVEPLSSRRSIVSEALSNVGVGSKTFLFGHSEMWKVVERFRSRLIAEKCSQIRLKSIRSEETIRVCENIEEIPDSADFDAFDVGAAISRTFPEYPVLNPTSTDDFRHMSSVLGVQRSDSPLLHQFDWDSIPIDDLVNDEMMEDACVVSSCSLEKPVVCERAEQSQKSVEIIEGFVNKKSNESEKREEIRVAQEVEESKVGDTTKEIMEMICDDCDFDDDVKSTQSDREILQGTFDLGIDELFASMTAQDNRSEPSEIEVKKKRKRPLGRNMLLTQAVDIDGESSEESDDDDIGSLQSFVDDRESHEITQQLPHTQMQARYFESLKSPSINFSDIHGIQSRFAQNPDDSDAYLIDSFCVASDESDRGEANDSSICRGNEVAKRRKIARIEETDDDEDK